MTIDEFRASVAKVTPPDGISTALHAMWEDARGKWDEAHQLAQGIADDQAKSGAWVHAYLHRKEGDLSNASYWYRQAGKPVPNDRLDEEWTRIVTALL